MEKVQRNEEPPKGGGGPSTALRDGYDSVSGELRASALAGDDSEDGPATSAHIAVCEGMSQLTQALKVDQSLAIEFGEIGKIDEKVEFSRNQKATTESLSIVVYARHRVKKVTVKNPKLRFALDAAMLADFVSEYGDSYVDSVALGGEYYAVYTFHTQTSEEQKDLKASLDAKGVKAGNSIEVDVMVQLNEFAKRSETAWTFDQRLSGVSAQLPKPDEIADFARGLSKMDFSHPVVIERSIARYENVPGFTVRKAFEPVIQNRDYFLASESGLLSTLVKIAARKNKAEWIQAIHACYGYKGDGELAKLQAALDTDREAIRAQLLEYRRNPLKRLSRPPLPSLDKGTPMLQYEKGTSEQWGRKTGTEQFNYPGVEQALHARMRLAWILLRASNYADKITMGYRDMHGERGPWSIGGSGGGGVEQNRLSLDSNEYVQRVDVRCGDIIDRLEITTTAGNKTWAGGTGGGPASFEAKDGRIILGFQGSGGVDIQTLQVVWVKLKDSTYQV